MPATAGKKGAKTKQPQATAEKPITDRQPSAELPKQEDDKIKSKTNQNARHSGQKGGKKQKQPQATSKKPTSDRNRPQNCRNRNSRRAMTVHHTNQNRKPLKINKK